MYKPKRSRCWALALLATGLCCAGGSALAQNAKTGSIANQNAQPPVKILTNPNLQRRQDAMDALATAVNARTQTDPQFKKYIESVDKYNKDMSETVKAKKGGAR